MITFTTTTVVLLSVFFTLAALGIVASVAALTEFAVSNRRIRVARHESVGTYYRGLALTH